MALVTFDAALNHLRQQGALSTSPPDDDLTLKIEQASALVLVHVKRPAEWDIDSDPTQDPEFAIVQAAVFKVLGNLYRFRGDDEKPMNPVGEDVIAMLSMLRDPALA